MPIFFAKYMFELVPTNRAVHNKKKLINLHIKARPPIARFVDEWKLWNAHKASRSFQPYITLIFHQNVY